MQTSPLLGRAIGLIDRAVSVLVLLVAVLLVAFMACRLAQASYAFVGYVVHEPVAWHESDSGTPLPAEVMLHAIALTAVLVKAYRMLIAYATRLHLSVRSAVEISIVAAAIEIAFNSRAYDAPHLALMGAFGVANLTLLVLFHERLAAAERAGADADEIPS